MQVKHFLHMKHEIHQMHGGFSQQLILQRLYRKVLNEIRRHRRGGLSHGRRDKLEKSLKSYEENGLIDMVGDNFIFFNEVSSDDISLIENDYKKFEWGGHPVNCGIGWGMVKGITECNTKYVLFLENDFELVANKDDIYRQLELGLRNLDKW